MTAADPGGFGDELGNREPILEKDKRNVLIAGTVDTIGEIPSCFGNADCDFFHKIRLSDIRDNVNWSKIITSMNGWKRFLAFE